MSKVPPLTGVAFGGAWPLPNTTPTPEVGETVRAADVQMAAQGLLNADASFEARGAFNTVARPAGNAGTFAFVGTPGIVATTVQIAGAEIGEIAMPNASTPLITLNPGNSGIALAQSFTVDDVNGHVYFGSPRTFTRVCRTRAKFSAPQWAESTPVDARHSYTQGLVANPPDNAVWLEFDVDLPNGCTVTELRWFVDPPSGHSGALPSLPPRLQLVRQDLTTLLGYTVSAEGADTTAAGSYEAAHEVVVPSLSVAIDGSHQWVVRARGEHGTNAFVNLLGYTPRVVITMPYALEGG